MAHPLSFLAGAGFGAGAMYFLDPNTGNRRRALVRDQFVHAGRQAARAVDLVKRDAANRLQGVAAEVRASLRPDHPSDDVLEARTRSAIGRCVSHPSAIEVRVHDGCVCLSGPVLADEVEQLIAGVRRVRGVRRVDNQLEVFDEPGNVSALQGGRRRTGPRMELAQQNWSPTTQALVTLGGLGLAACCATRRNPLAMLIGAAGLAASYHAMTRIDTRGRNPRLAPCERNQLRTSTEPAGQSRESAGVQSSDENAPDALAYDL